MRFVSHRHPAQRRRLAAFGKHGDARYRGIGAAVHSPCHAGCGSVEHGGLIARGKGLLLITLLSCGESAKHDYVVTQSFPHDTSAYTQGLLYHAGALYESTGEYGHSSVRRVELATGRSTASVALPTTRFGEGLARFGDRLYQLTWQSHIGYVYDLTTLARVDSFSYEGEGWGLTSDTASLIMSDGTDTLRFLDPRTYQVIRKVGVRDGESPLKKINELELVRGVLLANIYQSDWVVAIEPATGRIRRWIDLVGLLPERSRTATTDVLNGIAYDAEQDRLFVTGKRWPTVFELRLTIPTDSR
ncbi:MAG: glutamine cyclotransferase [Gemmatimonadetes bacterium]|nr:MAG: glutamine cyclotransferase [Gemmatimonadota bacterium]